MGMDGPAKSVEHLGQVAAHRGLCSLAVTSAQRVDDRLVLVQRAFGPAGAKRGLELKANALRLEPANDAGCGAMAGRRPYAFVELRVQLRVAECITVRHAVAHLGCHGVERCQVVGADPRGGPSSKHALEGGPDLLSLQRLPAVDEPDAGAPIVLEHHQAFLVQPDQGRSNRGPPSPDELGDRGLHQPLVGMKTAGHDCLAQLVVRVLARGSDSHRLLSTRLSSIMSTIGGGRSHREETVDTFRRHLLSARIALPAVAAILLAACGSSSSAGSGLGTRDLLVRVLAPLSGPAPHLGPAYSPP